MARLLTFRGRAAGTDAERRTARHLAARLEQLGRRAQIEPTRVRPAFALALLAQAALGIVGSVLSVSVPVAGAALVLAAAVSAFGELTGSFFLTRLLTGVRASQNVFSPEDAGKPGRLILVANYDAGRSGALLRHRLRAWPAVFFWSLMVILVCATARLFGLDATWLTAVQFAPTVALIALVPLFAELALAQPEPDENRNASGVATVLRLADRYGGALDHFDLTVLLTGADDTAPLGTRAWLRRHRGELDPVSTAVVCVDGAGRGTPHFATKEGPLFPARHHPALVSICEQIESGTPYVARALSGAYAARSAGLPAVRVASFGQGAGVEPDAVDPDALARSYEFLCELVERIDAEIGPRLGE